MPKFIKSDELEVKDGAGNSVFLKRRLDMGAVLRIQEAAGAHESLLALYVNSIVRWEGPDFKGYRCTPENIEKVDYEDPFWIEVADKIAELNKKLLGREEAESPLPPTTTGTPLPVENLEAADGMISTSA